MTQIVFTQLNDRKEFASVINNRCMAFSNEWICECLGSCYSSGCTQSDMWGILSATTWTPTLILQLLNSQANKQANADLRRLSTQITYMTPANVIKNTSETGIQLYCIVGRFYLILSKCMFNDICLWRRLLSKLHYLSPRTILRDISN